MPSKDSSAVKRRTTTSPARPRDSSSPATGATDLVRNEMPSQLVRFVMATVALALVATAIALSVPSVRSSIWGGSRADLLLTTKKDVLDLQSKPSTGAPHVEVLAVYPHDPKAFTQGLLVATQGTEKFLIESTGLNGESSLRKVDIETGEVITKFNLEQELFGEGVALNKRGELVMLTWQNKKALVFDLSPEKNGSHAFVLKRETPFTTTTGEGWGIDSNGTHFAVSDGSSTIAFWNAETLKEERRVTVTHRGEPVEYLNELEFANGFIYANIWFQHAVVKIDPADGKIVQAFNCRELVSQAEEILNHNNVLNGIAYDGDEDVFYLTGKRWRSVFKVRLSE
ncbi:hypothetical protein P43SY_007013 [Pythium insidiosum]|uniref:Glutamine cyclotransferase n=1 Tax=Pythium insidiosum TaxID=114742 RepID=A0AAD5M903_PYTIN|nr:hypothetical protein P43SY_007013 [Pythium insidiosum]